MYKEVIDKTVDFLFNNQVILDNQTVILATLEKGIKWGSFSSKVLRSDKKEAHFLVGSKDNKVYIKENGKIKGPFNKFFRLEFGDFNYTISKKENKAISKMNLKDKLCFLLKRVYFHSKSSLIHLLHGDSGPLFDLIKKFKKEKELKNSGFKIIKSKKLFVLPEFEVKESSLVKSKLNNRGYSLISFIFEKSNKLFNFIGLNNLFGKSLIIICKKV